MDCKKTGRKNPLICGAKIIGTAVRIFCIVKIATGVAIFYIIKMSTGVDTFGVFKGCTAGNPFGNGRSASRNRLSGLPGIGFMYFSSGNFSGKL